MNFQFRPMNNTNVSPFNMMPNSENDSKWLHDLLAVDIGRGYVKWKTWNREGKFESIIDTAVKLTVYTKEEGDMILQDGDTKLFIGDLADRDGSGMKRKPTTDSKATDDVKRLFYGALYQAGMKSGVIDVCTCAPKTNFDDGDAKKFHEMLLGTHRFTINDEQCEVTVRKCWIDLEGGVIIHHLQKEGLIMDRYKKFRVIDPGAKTTNYATYTYSKGKWYYTNGESGTLPRGWENDGSGKKEVKVDPDELSNMISSHVQNSWIKDAPIFVIGGGASRIEEPLKKSFPNAHIHVLTDAQFANLRGCWEKGVKERKKLAVNR